MADRNMLDINAVPPEKLDLAVKHMKATTTAHIVTASILSALQLKTKAAYVEELKAEADKL